MNNEDYREIVESERHVASDRIYFLKANRAMPTVEQKLWLLVLGLIETWNMKI